MQLEVTGGEVGAILTCRTRETGGPGHSLTSDGKWNPSTKDLGGYSILQAENIEAAKKLLEGHPHLMWMPGCSVEVAEMVPMM